MTFQVDYVGAKRLKENGIAIEAKTTVVVPDVASYEAAASLIRNPRRAIVNVRQVAEGAPTPRPAQMPKRIAEQLMASLNIRLLALDELLDCGEPCISATSFRVTFFKVPKRLGRPQRTYPIYVKFVFAETTAAAFEKVSDPSLNILSITLARPTDEFYGKNNLVHPAEGITYILPAEGQRTAARLAKKMAKEALAQAISEANTAVADLEADIESATQAPTLAAEYAYLGKPYTGARLRATNSPVSRTGIEEPAQPIIVTDESLDAAAATASDIGLTNYFPVKSQRSEWGTKEEPSLCTSSQELLDEVLILQQEAPSAKVTEAAATELPEYFDEADDCDEADDALFAAAEAELVARAAFWKRVGYWIWHVASTLAAVWTLFYCTVFFCVVYLHGIDLAALSQHPTLIWILQHVYGVR